MTCFSVHTSASQLAAECPKCLRTTPGSCSSDGLPTYCVALSATAFRDPVDSIIDKDGVSVSSVAVRVHRYHKMAAEGQHYLVDDVCNPLQRFKLPAGNGG